MEIWKDIPSFEGYYQVSNIGNVRSIERVIKTKAGKVQVFKSRSLKKDILNRGSGYYRVFLSKNSKRFSFLIHRLVMYAFFGVKDLSVDHINGNSLDNNLSNLRYCTHRDNLVSYRINNKHKTSSKYVGVSWDKKCKKWSANISINGKGKFLGYFDDEYKASQVYQFNLRNRLQIESH